MRYSKQRDLIYSIINNSYEHLTADLIYKEARETLTNISLGTVYRNLSELVTDNKIRQIPVSGGKDYYDKTLIPHGHLTCLKCGSIVDVEYEFNKNLIEQHNNIELTQIEFTCLGYCHKCRGRK